jgi:transposase InsO family protein
LKAAVEKRYKPSYSETHIRKLFFHCTMQEGQTSRAFLQECWAAIRRTSCTDPVEQLQWVLTCFTSRHTNPEVVQVFDLKAPKTEEEALQIADDVEGKQRDRATTAKVTAVLQASASSGSSAEVAAVNVANRGRNGGNRGGVGGNSGGGGSGGARGTRGRGGNQLRPSTGNDCPGCGRAPRCGQGQCPAANQNCYECGKRGHLGRVCFERKRRLGNGAARSGGTGQFRRSANECDQAGPGYVEQREQFRYEQQRYDRPSGEQYAQDAVGYMPRSSFGHPPPSFLDVHEAQWQYLRDLSTRASPQRPQLVPKASSGRQQQAFEPMNIDEVSTSTHSIDDTDVWFEKLSVGSRSIRAKIDTGARVNVMSLSHFRALGLRENILRPSNIVLVSFTRSLVNPIGSFTMRVKIGSESILATFHVVPSCANVLISFRDALRARLLFVPGQKSSSATGPVDTLSTYNGEVYSLCLRDDAVPRTFPARKVPLALDNEVQEELQRMEREGVITRVNEPTEWCSPMIVRRKPNGLLRVCMDPRYLNSYLRRATYPLPDVDQVFTKFRGAKFFSKMDLTMGFWQVALDERSSYLCTFSTPYGRYRYLRLPFGISPAPEVFHRIVADVIRDLPGVLHFVDDILVWGNTKEEHDARLKIVLDRFAKVDFTFNPAKCTFGKPEVMFLGHLVNGERIRPDPRKIESVRKFPAPTCVEEVRRLLGVATYISKFIPRFSAKTSVLRQLLRADAAFVWTSEHDAALQAIKDELTSDHFLYIFDPRLPVQVATDACSSGLGAVLLQNDRPIAYAARSLTSAESNYSIIEKELLAVVFALTRFHFYTAGRRVTVLTDHQPLLGAARNVLVRDNPRLDRLFDKIISYDLSWVYVPGKENFLPDFLSRLPTSCMPASCEVDEAGEVPIACGPTYDAIRAASVSDVLVQFVRECSHASWPKARAACPPFARFLWPSRHSVRILDDVLLDEHDRVYVPPSARPAVLQEVHLGHPGVSASLRRATKYFFWNTIRVDIEQHVANCVPCAMHAPRQAAEPLLRRPMPSSPGETVAGDFFQLGSRYYLALYDVFSQFPLLWPVSHPSAHAVIQACRVFFQFTGCPRHWWSDRGGAFDSADFRAFAASIGMQLHFSSAEYPQSNGSAESAVKLLKRMREVCTTDDQLFRAALYMQGTAKRNHTLSPAQVLLGRSPRTPLNPIATQSAVSWKTHFLERIADQRQSREPKSVSIPRDFLPGDKVLVHNVRGSSQTAVVVSLASEPRAYIVEFPSGARSVRNRIFLTPIPRSLTRNAGNPSPTTTSTSTSLPARPEPPSRPPLSPKISTPLGSGQLPVRNAPGPANKRPNESEPSFNGPARPTPPSLSPSPLLDTVRPPRPTSSLPPSTGPVYTRTGRLVRPLVKYRST